MFPVRDSDIFVHMQFELVSCQLSDGTFSCKNESKLQTIPNAAYNTNPYNATPSARASVTVTQHRVCMCVCVCVWACVRVCAQTLQRKWYNVTSNVRAWMVQKIVERNIKCHQILDGIPPEDRRTQQPMRVCVCVNP